MSNEVKKMVKNLGCLLVFGALCFYMGAGKTLLIISFSVFGGGFLNLIALLLNEGKMPVGNRPCYHKFGPNHCRLTEKSRVKFLCDIFSIDDIRFSIGDVIIIFAYWSFIIWALYSFFTIVF